MRARAVCTGIQRSRLVLVSPVSYLRRDPEAAEWLQAPEVVSPAQAGGLTVPQHPKALQRVHHLIFRDRMSEISDPSSSRVKIALERHSFFASRGIRPSCAEVMARRLLRRDASAASPATHRTFRGHDALEWAFHRRRATRRAA
jgi:hypothetical protein